MHFSSSAWTCWVIIKAAKQPQRLQRSTVARQLNPGTQNTKPSWITKCSESNRFPALSRVAHEHTQLHKIPGTTQGHALQKRSCKRDERGSSGQKPQYWSARLAILKPPAHPGFHCSRSMITGLDHRSSPFSSGTCSGVYRAERHGSVQAWAL